MVKTAAFIFLVAARAAAIIQGNTGTLTRVYYNWFLIIA
jgi:hypothetical protein